MKNDKRISEDVWRTCVTSMPIFGIDMIIFSSKNGILMGRRINNPAKGKLFVPGGRVYKNESIRDAFNRILLTETGLIYSFQESTSIGIYEHFYNNTKWSIHKCSTHYIIEARLIEINPDKKLEINLDEQHSNCVWVRLEDYKSYDIHHYSKIYIERIREIKAK